MKNKRINAPQPFFSIIITAYNRVQLIKRALNSLISQTEKDWEAIIIDDGSTDETYAQILPFLNKYPKIRYFKKVHSGEAQSKNEGIYASNGKFISFLDSDDAYRPDHLKSRKNILLENPSIQFLYGGLEVIGNQYVPDRFDYSKKILIQDCVAGGTFFIERNIVLLLNGFNEISIGTDADLFERAKESKIEMMQTNIPSYIYHHETRDSLTNNVLKGHSF